MIHERCIYDAATNRKSNNNNVGEDDRPWNETKIKLIRFAPKVVANGRSLCTRQNELIPQYSRKTCLLLAT